VLNYILGEHGDTQFAAWSSARAGGVPLSNFAQLTPQNLDKLEEETRKRVYEIIACKGATFFGIATCVTIICEAIIFNQRLVLPLSCYIEKFGVCLSMPVVLGANGIEQVFSIPLNNQEQEKLMRSVERLQSIKKQCKI
jgi:L-lactate dehydrogenase